MEKSELGKIALEDPPCLEPILQQVDLAASLLVGDSQVVAWVGHRLQQKDVVGDIDERPALVGAAVVDRLHHLEVQLGEDCSQVQS